MKLHRCYFLFAGFGMILGAAEVAPAQEKQPPGTKRLAISDNPYVVEVREKLPPGSKLLRIEARPTPIALKNPYEYSQLILTGQLDSGDKIDVTRMAQLQAPANLVKVSPTGIVRPVADGQGSLKCSIAGQMVEVPI